jgi:hypothetical protein
MCEGSELSELSELKQRTHSLASARLPAHDETQNRTSEHVGRPGIEPGTYGLKEQSSNSLILWPAPMSPQLLRGSPVARISQGSYWQVHWQACLLGGADAGGGAAGLVAGVL